MVLPAESVVVTVLMAPGSLLVVVNVEPAVLVHTMTTGMTLVNLPLEALVVDVAMTVEPETDTVVILPIVMGIQ